MHTYTVLVKYAKLCSENMQKYAGLYAKHAFIAYFTFICTPHFADGLMAIQQPNLRYQEALDWHKWTNGGCSFLLSSARAWASSGHMRCPRNAYANFR